MIQEGGILSPASHGGDASGSADEMKNHDDGASQNPDGVRFVNEVTERRKDRLETSIQTTPSLSLELSNSSSHPATETFVSKPFPHD